MGDNIMDSSTQICRKNSGTGFARQVPGVISLTTMLVTLLVYGLVGCDNSVSHPEPVVQHRSSSIFADMPLSAAKGEESAIQLSEISVQNVGIPTPELVLLKPLGRGTFPHPIDAKFKLKYGNRMEVVQFDNVSDVIAAKLTIQEGGSTGWHRHPGSAFGVVVSGTFGIIEETDCVLRTYKAGQVFFHRGQGIIDVGFNAGEGDVVVYLTFMGVPPGLPPTMPPDGDSPCPL
jgi:hypothetical protein